MKKKFNFNILWISFSARQMKIWAFCGISFASLGTG